MDIIVANIEPENLKNFEGWHRNSDHDGSIAVYGPDYEALSQANASHDLFGHWSYDLRQSTGNLLDAYEAGWRREDLSAEAVIGFIHDDVAMFESQWDSDVWAEFDDDPKVGVVGFGGALRLGHRDLYKIPYRLPLLAREDYRSNTEDWAGHGHQCTEPMTVAVIDGFAMFVRRELLDRMGGWQPEKWPPHHCYDLRLCCEAKRHGYKVRIVPVRCRHLGGGTSVKHSEKVKEVFKAAGYESDQDAHEKGHRMIYEEYADVLPIREL